MESDLLGDRAAPAAGFVPMGQHGKISWVAVGLHPVQGISLLHPVQGISWVAVGFIILFLFTARATDFTPTLARSLPVEDLLERVGDGTGNVSRPLPYRPENALLPRISIPRAL